MHNYGDRIFLVFGFWFSVLDFGFSMSCNAISMLKEVTYQLSQFYPRDLIILLIDKLISIKLVLHSLIEKIVIYYCLSLNEGHFFQKFENFL